MLHSIRKGWLFINRMRPYRARYVLGLLGDGAVSASVPVILAFVFKFLIDSSLHNQAGLFVQAVVLTVGVFLLLGILSPLTGYLYVSATKRFAADLKVRLYRQLVRMKVDAYLARHSGDWIARMTSDLQLMEKGYTEFAKTLTVNVLIAVGSTAALFWIDWRFALGLMLFVASSIWLNAKYSQTLRRINDRIQTQTSRLTEWNKNLVSGNLVIKMYHLKRLLYGRFIGDNAEMKQLQLRQGNRLALLDSINYLYNFVTFGGIIIVGAFVYVQGHIEFSSIVAIVQLQLSLNGVLLALGGVIAQMQSALAGTERVLDILDTPVEYQLDFSAVEEPAAEDGKLALDMNKVMFAYEEGQAVLRRVQLQVPAGETAAVVGFSGSGKTTLFKLLLGFYLPLDGEIRYFGRQRALAELRRLIAYVPQDVVLFDGTIEENIRCVNPEASEEAFIEAVRAAYAFDFIRELPDGFQTQVGEKGANLSGGQRQRIGIARALLRAAPILLLDEATSALDSESEFYIQQALKDIGRQRTVLVIAHRLSTIEHADRIFVMSEGTIAEQGTHSELLQRGGIYAKLHAIQQKPALLAATR